MADAIIANDSKNLWREARKINPKKKSIPNTINGINGDKTISELFADKYTGHYNSVPYDVDTMNRIKDCVQQSLHNNVGEYDEVTTDDIESSISQLKIGKHDGDQWLESDHLIYSTKLLHRILSDFSLRDSHIAECITVLIPKDGRWVNDLK